MAIVRQRTIFRGGSDGNQKLYRSVNASTIKPKPDVYHPLRNRTKQAKTWYQQQDSSKNSRTYSIGWAPSPSHSKDSKKPKKHHAESAVSKKKSAIILLNAKKTKLSDNQLKAKRGTSTGAAKARTSKACSVGPGKPVLSPWIRRLL